MVSSSVSASLNVMSEQSAESLLFGGLVRSAQKTKTAPIAITVAIIWAIALIFILPFVAVHQQLAAGIGGAWNGTSEFADGRELPPRKATAFRPSSCDRRQRGPGDLCLHVDQRGRS
jgi:hypothetical protein